MKILLTISVVGMALLKFNCSAPVAVQWLLRPTLPASDLKSGNQYTLLNMPQRLQKFRCDRDARIFWY